MSLIFHRVPAFIRADSHLLPRCLLMAALVHLWLALMIGARVGPNLPGQSPWGRLTISLQGQGDQAADAEGEGVTPAWRDDGPEGSARASRHGGQLRREAPPADAGPGAQKLGRWKAQPLAPAPDRPELDNAGTQGEGVQELPARQQAAEQAPAAVVEAPSPSATAAAQTAVLALPREAAPSPPALRQLAPVEAPRSAARAARIAPPTLTPLPGAPAMAMPESPTVIEEPVLRTLAAPSVARPAARRETLVVPKASALPQRLDSLSSAPALQEPPDVAVVAPPEAAPVAPRDAPPVVQPEQKLPPAAAPSPRVDTPVTPTPASRSANPTVAPAGTPPAAQRRGDPLADPAPGPRASAGSPDAGARVGHDVATAPSAAASAPLPPLNLSLPRANAAAARRESGVLSLLPALPDRKSKLEKAVDEASREDCRKAHEDKGVLALAPLAADSLRGKGCKW